MSLTRIIAKELYEWCQQQWPSATVGWRTDTSIAINFAPESWGSPAHIEVVGGTVRAYKRLDEKNEDGYIWDEYFIPMADPGCLEKLAPFVRHGTRS